MTYTKQEKDWQDVFTHRVGVDFTYKERCSVRAGLYYDNTPIKDGYVSPELPDVTHLGYTAGISYTINKTVSIDLSFLRQNAEREASLDAAGFTAKYRRKANVYSIGVNITLGGKDKSAAAAPSEN